ncbi:MAG: hypothetical protein ACE5KX_03825 [Acidimicrobiia bacterium]
MKQKFSSQADPDLLAEVRAIAAEEGRQFQSVLDEALSEWVDRKRGLRPRSEVLAHLKDSMARNRELYRRLAE